MNGKLKAYIRELLEDASIDTLKEVLNYHLDICDEISKMIIEKRKGDDIPF